MYMYLYMYNLTNNYIVISIGQIRHQSLAVLSQAARREAAVGPFICRYWILIILCSSHYNIPWLYSYELDLRVHFYQ